MQVAQRHLVEERRQPRIAQSDLVGERDRTRARAQASSSANGVAARPGLRRAGHRIERRPSTALALEAAEQLRQAPQVHVGRRRRTGPRITVSIGRFKTVAREAQAQSGRCRAARSSRCDRTSDCSALRRVATVRMPQPEKKSGRNRPFATQRGARRIGDAGEENLAGIRGAHATGPLVRRRAPARRSRFPGTRRRLSKRSASCVGLRRQARRPRRSRPIRRAQRAAMRLAA